MKINQDGIDLIKEFEGCRLTPYKDIRGVWTIGYGHISGVDSTTPDLTSEGALELLIKDLLIFEAGVSTLVRKIITDNEFSALVSFAYNLGLHSLASSTLLNCINKGHIDLAANEFLKWDHDGNKVIPGLARRREAERQLFLKDHL